MIDCEYRDARGILYLVYGQSLDRKRIIVAHPVRGWLPYGLTGEETPEQALRHLGDRYEAPFQLDAHDGQTFVGSYGANLPNSAVASGNNLGFDVVLTFGPSRKLEEITIGGSTPED